MKVLDVIKLVCDFVGEKELLPLLETGDPLSDIQQQKVDRMTRCFNLVNQEIASDYIPYMAKEEVSGSMISFSELSKTVVHIYEVRNRFGINLKFKLYPNFVEVNGNAKTVVYSYLPQELGVDDDVESVSGLNARVFAYGVASEYLLIDGVSDDAEIWENRFKESLFVLSRKRGEHVLPRRRWL